MLQDHPILRERVLAVSAISAVLIGGALAMNSIITGGWQWGVASATPHQLSYHDQQRNAPAPSAPVSPAAPLASASYTNASNVHTVTPEQAAANARALDGSAPATSFTSHAPQAAPVENTPPAPPIDDAASKARFDQIEADIRQADPQSASATGAEQDGGG